jgi:hypothetical protein
MARSALTGAVPDAVVATGRLGGESPLPAGQGERLAERKGVLREVGSEGQVYCSCNICISAILGGQSGRQNTGLTNKNRIRGSGSG